MKLNQTNKRLLSTLLPLCAATALIPMGCARAQTEATAAPAAKMSAKTIAIAPNALGYNGNLLRGGSWNDPQLVQAFQSLEPGTIRYPAGTLANYWDWRRGGIDTATPDLPHGWEKTNAKPYGIKELKTVYGETGATPIFVLNMLTSTLDEQLALLRAVKEAELPVTYVELGNEYYLSSKAYVAKYPTAPDYAREANRWTAAIKAEFPEAKVSAVGAAVRPTDNARRKTWNGLLIPLLKGEDAISIHVYQGNGLGDTDKLMEAKGLVEDDDDKGKAPKPKGMWGSKPSQEAQWQVLNTDTGLKNMLSMPFSRANEMKELDLLPAGMAAWITEYNMFDRTGPVRGTWAHGIISAGLTLNMLGDERVQLMCFHDLYGPPQFAAIFGGDGGFDALLTGETPSATPYALTASGRSLQLVGRAMKGMTQMEMLEFANNPKIKGRTTYNALFGRAFSGPQGRSALVINFSGKAFGLKAGAFPDWAKGAKTTMISGAPRSYVTGPDSLKEQTVMLGDALNVPPYSVVLMEAAK